MPAEVYEALETESIIFLQRQNGNTRPSRTSVTSKRQSGKRPKRPKRTRQAILKSRGGLRGPRPGLRPVCPLRQDVALPLRPVLSAPQRYCRVRTEVTFGRSDLSACPLGGFTGAHECLISYWRGCPPGVPTGTNTKGTSAQGHFCASLRYARRVFRTKTLLPSGKG